MVFFPKGPQNNVSHQTCASDNASDTLSMKNSGLCSQLLNLGVLVTTVSLYNFLG